jgi:hypothetical protein
MSTELSPGSGGPLVDPDGGTWTMSRRRLDLRLMRRALRADATERLLLGESGGFDIRWVEPAERPQLWRQLRDGYNGPGSTSQGPYAGYTFVDAAGREIVYIEVSC